MAGDRKAVEAGDPLELGSRGLLVRVSGEVLPHELDGAQRDRLGLRGRAGQRLQRVGDRRGDLDRRELADRLVDVGEQARDLGGRGRRIPHRIGDEGQRRAVERAADQLGLHVDDPVAEALGRGGPAVVELVGVEDVNLPRKRNPPCAAVAEGLDAAARDPDRVGVVPMQLERPLGEEGLGPFQPGRTGARPGSSRTIVQDRCRPRLVASPAWANRIEVAEWAVRFSRCCSARSRSWAARGRRRSASPRPAPCTASADRSATSRGSSSGRRSSCSRWRAASRPCCSPLPAVGSVLIAALGRLHPLARVPHRDRTRRGRSRRRRRAGAGPQGRHAARSCEPEGLGGDRGRVRERASRLSMRRSTRARRSRCSRR